MKTVFDNHSHLFKGKGVIQDMSGCNCNHGECSGDKSNHKHKNGQCIHPDGTKHPIHEKH